MIIKKSVLGCWSLEEILFSFEIFLQLALNFSKPVDVAVVYTKTQLSLLSSTGW